MLAFGVVVAIIGAVVAAWVHRQIGIGLAIVGFILIVWALLAGADTAEAVLRL